MDSRIQSPDFSLLPEYLCATCRQTMQQVAVEPSATACPTTTQHSGLQPGSQACLESIAHPFTGCQLCRIQSVERAALFYEHSRVRTAILRLLQAGFELFCDAFSFISGQACAFSVQSFRQRLLWRGRCFAVTGNFAFLILASRLIFIFLQCPLCLSLLFPLVPFGGCRLPGLRGSSNSGRVRLRREWGVCFRWFLLLCGGVQIAAQKDCRLPGKGKTVAGAPAVRDSADERGEPAQQVGIMVFDDLSQQTD